MKRNERRIVVGKFGRGLAEDNDVQDHRLLRAPVQRAVASSANQAAACPLYHPFKQHTSCLLEQAFRRNDMHPNTPSTAAGKSHGARLEAHISVEQKATLQHAASAGNTHALRSVAPNCDA